MSDSMRPYGLIVAREAPLSMGFSRQEYWSGLPCPPPGDLPDPGIKPTSLMSPALAGEFFPIRGTGEAPDIFIYTCTQKHIQGYSLHYFHDKAGNNLWVTDTLLTHQYPFFPFSP